MDPETLVGQAVQDPFGGRWTLIRGRWTGTWWMHYRSPAGQEDWVLIRARAGPGLPARLVEGWRALQQFGDHLSALLDAVADLDEDQGEGEDG